MDQFWTPLAKAQIENRVIQVLEVIGKDRPLEDAFVELKSEWPEDHKKTARQLAASANAARGERVIWVIGANEKGSVPGAKRAELATWWPQVERHFQASGPELVLDMVVHYGKVVVVTLVFDTTRPPYVFKSSTDLLEVPWREGTRTRSARHQDLIRLLVPLQLVPEFDLIGARIRADRVPDTAAGMRGRCEFGMDLYVYPKSSDRVCIPFRRCRARINIPGWFSEEWEGLVLKPITQRVRLVAGEQFVDKSQSLTIDSTQSEALIDGPGVLRVRAEYQFEGSLPEEVGDKIDATAYLRPVGAEIDAVVKAELDRITPEVAVRYEWLFGKMDTPWQWRE
jgi:hypothetical protein